MRQLERIFEGTARATFRNDVPGMLAVRDLASAMLVCGDDDTTDWMLAASLRVRIDPPVLILDEQDPASDPPQLSARSLYLMPTGSAYEVMLVVELVDDHGAAHVLGRVTASAGRGAQSVGLSRPIDASLCKPGTYTLRVRTPGGLVVASGSWTVRQRSLDTLRTRLAGVLDDSQHNAGPDELQAARAIARSRLALVTDTPVPDRLVGLTTRPDQIARAVQAEVEAISRGQDPYRDQPGTIWRTFTHRGRAIPLSVTVPRGVVGAAPLVIALHGISADEQVFAEGYGDGLLTTLAQEHGFVVASPLSYVLLTSDSALDEIIEAASEHATIDRQRVFVLGYSMGGIEALRLARTRRDRLAGVCAITGTTRVPQDPDIAPALMVVGQQDPLVSLKVVEDRVADAASRGVPVELLVMPDSSHILIVSAAMPRAIQWLLARPPSEGHAKQNAPPDEGAAGAP